METTDWAAGDANLRLFCNASGHALGFWSPSHSAGFFSPLQNDTHTIFYNEALCVLSALAWAVRLSPRPRKIAIHTDSLNTVEIFHSLKAEDGYNDLLMSAVTMLLDFHVHLRVFFLPGVENTVADALSRLLPHVATSLVPGLSIEPFTPPRVELEATAE